MGKGKINSLTSNYEFQRVYRRGTPCYGKYLILYKRKSNVKGAKLGITVTKKVGKACIRNRARRLIFESFRLYYDDIKSNCDIVVVAKPSIVQTDFLCVNNELFSLLKKAGLC